MVYAAYACHIYQHINFEEMDVNSPSPHLCLYHLWHMTGIEVMLEMILDKVDKISHEQFTAQLEARLGSGEGNDIKCPDMKTWDKGCGLAGICSLLPFASHLGLNGFESI